MRRIKIFENWLLQQQQAVVEGSVVNETVHPENFTSDMIKAFLDYVSVKNKRTPNATTKSRKKQRKDPAQAGEDVEDAEDEEEELSDDIVPDKFLQPKSIDVYCAAIKTYYFKSKEKETPAAVKKGVDIFNIAYERCIADKREQGQHPHETGKAALNREGYRMLALWAAKCSSVHSDYGVKVWPYLILSWNCLNRCSSTAEMKLDYFSWAGDAMVVHLVRHKGDEAGVKCFPKHLYANPLKPEMCPVLSLAVLIFAKCMCLLLIRLYLLVSLPLLYRLRR
jgi:hypothetical protein